MKEFEGEWSLGVLGKKTKEREREVERLRRLIARNYEESLRDSAMENLVLRSRVSGMDKRERELISKAVGLQTKLDSTRARVGAKTREVNGLRRAYNTLFSVMQEEVAMSKSQLGRFYWPATAYCEATLPCI